MGIEKKPTPWPYDTTGRSSCFNMSTSWHHWSTQFQKNVRKSEKNPEYPEYPSYFFSLRKSVGGQVKSCPHLHQWCCLSVFCECSLPMRFQKVEPVPVFMITWSYEKSSTMFFNPKCWKSEQSSGECTELHDSVFSVREGYWQGWAETI